ncbi:MAG: hypothetical protein ACKV2O_23390 [Acidimicrobiales bacterium]
MEEVDQSAAPLAGSYGLTPTRPTEQAELANVGSRCPEGVFGLRAHETEVVDGHQSDDAVTGHCSKAVGRIGESRLIENFPRVTFRERASSLTNLYRHSRLLQGPKAELIAFTHSEITILSPARLNRLVTTS